MADDEATDEKTAPAGDEGPASVAGETNDSPPAGDAGDAGDGAPAESPTQAASVAGERNDTVHGAPVTWSRDQKVLHPGRDQLVEVVCALRDEDDGFHVCLSVTGVDYLVHDGDRGLPEGVEPERFEVVVVLMSHARRERLRLRVQVPADDPVCPTLFDVHPGAEAMEREVYDMFGIRFDGHPDLSRILMPEDWEGHPLRKEHPIGKIPVQFKGAPGAR
jgi:NADH-quinone oxidoreductase subunit C